jgi:hypothetical protein
MKKLLVAVVAALALSGIIQGRAESSRLAAVDRPETTGTIRPVPAPVDTGSETYRGVTGPSVPVMPRQVPKPSDKVTLESLLAAWLQAMDDPCYTC